MTENVLMVISMIQPYDQLEAEQIQDAIDWIKRGSDIFRIQKPDVPNKHLVSYFVVWNEIASKILLVHHKAAGLWLPTGGHVEINEDPIDTVRRECMEELNCQAVFHLEYPVFLTSAVTVGATAGHTDVSLWYVLKGRSGDAYQFDRNEFYDIRWFSLDEIPYEMSDPHMHRFVKKLESITGK